MSSIPVSDLPLVNAQRAAELLGGIPVSTVRQLAREQRIPSVKIGRRVLFSEARLLEVVSSALDGQEPV